MLLNLYAFNRVFQCKLDRHHHYFSTLEHCWPEENSMLLSLWSYPVLLWTKIRKISWRIGWLKTSLSVVKNLGILWRYGVILSSNPCLWLRISFQLDALFFWLSIKMFSAWINYYFCINICFLLKTVDNDLALKIYIKARATPKVVAAFAERREFDKILIYSKQVLGLCYKCKTWYNINYLSVCLLCLQFLFLEGNI